ncbi:birA, partial [Symbiodinium microadriaticum]
DVVYERIREVREWPSTSVDSYSHAMALLMEYRLRLGPIDGAENVDGIVAVAHNEGALLGSAALESMRIFDPTPRRERHVTLENLQSLLENEGQLAEHEYLVLSGSWREDLSRGEHTVRSSLLPSAGQVVQLQKPGNCSEVPDDAAWTERYKGIKSLGASRKKPPDVVLDECIEYSERVADRSGYFFMDSPGNDLESIAGQAITNFPFVPTLKVVTTSGRFNILQKVTPTTMELAARELGEGAPHGTIILAEEMTQGRGRTGGRWISPKDGNLYVTLILRSAREPSLNAYRRSQANFATPLAVARAVKGIEPTLNPMIRWPRAVEIGGHKVSGSLIEVHDEEGVEHYAVGIGINVNAEFCNNETFSQNVTSLRCASQKVIDREQLLAEVCGNLDELLEMSPDDLQKQYLRWPSVTELDSEVSLLNKTSKQPIVDGKVHGITPAMDLVVQADNGSQIEVSEVGAITVFPKGRRYRAEL